MAKQGSGASGLLPRNDIVLAKRGTCRRNCILPRPCPSFYVLRLQRRASFIPALIYEHCRMIMLPPTAANGPNPEDWCRPLDHSPRYGALIDGRPVAVDRIWTARSLNPACPDEYAFRMRPLGRWARAPDLACGKPAPRAIRSHVTAIPLLKGVPYGPARARLHAARHRA